MAPADLPDDGPPAGQVDRRHRLGRRAFLGATAAAAGGALAGGVMQAARERTPGATLASTVQPFRGRHQAGVTAPPAPAGLVAGFDLRATDRAGLERLLTTLTDTIDRVMSGLSWDPREIGYPPQDTGMLGPTPGPTGTSVVVGLGASLFDHPERGDRFGLAGLRPPELVAMPRFANDGLVRPELSHGDLSIVVQADDIDAATHAMRQIRRVTRDDLIPRWQREGSLRLDPDRVEGGAPGRNLLGFKDGTANPDTADASALDEVVWVQAGDDHPSWAVGGTYQAVRIIRMLVEFWDRTRLAEQEAIFHRRRDSGAPLGRSAETDRPVFDDAAALESHIGRANPEAPAGQGMTMLRRGLNYTAGLDGNHQLDQGLLFTSYQRSLDRGFVAVQHRLDGEALEEYIRPLGGGFFFVPPGPAAGEILAQDLLEA